MVQQKPTITISGAPLSVAFFTTPFPSLRRHGRLGGFAAALGHPGWLTWAENSYETSIASHSLVGGLVAIFYFPRNIGFLIIPIDFHIFQRGSNHQPVAVGEWDLSSMLTSSWTKFIRRFFSRRVSREIPKWMVHNGKSLWKGWFRGTPILGNSHMFHGEKKHGIPSSSTEIKESIDAGSVMSSWELSHWHRSLRRMTFDFLHPGHRWCSRIEVKSGENLCYNQRWGEQNENSLCIFGLMLVSYYSYVIITLYDYVKYRYQTTSWLNKYKYKYKYKYIYKHEYEIIWIWI